MFLVKHFSYFLCLSVWKERRDYWNSEIAGKSLYHFQLLEYSHHNKMTNFEHSY